MWKNVVRSGAAVVEGVKEAAVTELDALDITAGRDLVVGISEDWLLIVLSVIILVASTLVLFGFTFLSKSFHEGTTTKRSVPAAASSARLVSSPEEAADISTTTPVDDQQKMVTVSSYSRLAALAVEDDKKLLPFEWLGWAPRRGSPASVAIHRHFAGAIPGSALVRRSSVILRENGVYPHNALFGTSICSDEINNEDGDQATQFRDYYGRMFPLGGIGGAPFAGKTGFKAFSHHVPDGGHIVILFGPHVGITNTGVVGKYERQGQGVCQSAACGAVRAAFDQCRSKGFDCSRIDSTDLQQSWLRCQLKHKIPQIERQSNVQAALAHAAYDVVANAIEDVVNLDFGPGKLILIGGIQINLSSYDDHFQPRLFQIRQRGQPTIDCLPDLATTLAYPR